MAKKSANRMAKKQKRKTFRQKKKTLRKLAQIKNNKKTNTLQNNNFKMMENQNIPPATATNDDDTPTSSKMATKKGSAKYKLKRSPLKAGCVKKFKKFRDDRAKKLCKRSRQIVRNIHKGQQVVRDGKIIHLNGSGRKTDKLPKTLRRMMNKWKSKDFKEESLQKTELSAIKCSEGNSAATKDVAADSSDDDDDCILVEKLPPPITIVDEDDDSDSVEDIQSIVNCTAGYQSLFQSFKERHTSTQHSANSSINNRNRPAHTIYRSSYNQPCLSTVTPDQRNNSFFFDAIGKAVLGFPNYELLNRHLTEKASEGNDVVILNDSTLKNCENSTSKDTNESESSSEDDGVDNSVIFVSETSPINYIPINNNSADVNVAAKPQHVAKQRAPLYSELFTRSEKKQMQAYNTNAYNPHAGQVFTSPKRMVIIDGSNVAFKHALEKEFSVKGLKIAIEYFQRMGHDVKAVIPQFRMNGGKSSDPLELKKLNNSGKIVQTPCKNFPGLTSTSYDDRFILQLASELDAAIVSNDNYRDLLHENPAFKKIIETRVIGYSWCNDIFILPKDPYGKWGPTLDMILNRS